MTETLQDIDRYREENAMARGTGGADVGRPNAARMYDYYLGGHANIEADREAADQVIAQAPAVTTFVRANRAWLGRAVRYLARAGIDQFLDLGSGLPTTRNVHQVAHEVNAKARVAYVDIESIAVTHARELVAGDERVSVTQADLREPRRVLSSPGVTGLLDFSRPVGIVASASLHFVPDEDDPAGIIACYRDTFPTGSYLAISHIARVAASLEQERSGLAVYAKTSTPVIIRSKEQIAALLPGYRLVDPGLVLLDQWRPDAAVSDEQAAQTNCYAAVGLLP